MEVVRRRRQQQRHEDPLLLKDTRCTYREVVDLIQRINFHESADPETQSRLPLDLAKRIVAYLIVERVDQTQVQVTDCSSHDGSHPLASCLQADEETWWLSAPLTMPRGYGREWLQFTLGPTLRRLTVIQIHIAPLPRGPLSVREFCIEDFSDEQGWHAISPVFVVQNRRGWQGFLLEESADVTQVRMICLSNQVSDVLDEDAPATHLRRLASVGFNSIRFL